MFDWHEINNYDKNIRMDINIDNGVDLPELNRELLFIRNTDNKIFMGELYKGRAALDYYELRLMSYHEGDVGLADGFLNGTKWCYVERP